MGVDRLEVSAEVVEAASRLGLVPVRRLTGGVLNEVWEAAPADGSSERFVVKRFAETLYYPAGSPTELLLECGWFSHCDVCPGHVEMFVDLGCHVMEFYPGVLLEETFSSVTVDDLVRFCFLVWESTLMFRTPPFLGLADYLHATLVSDPSLYENFGVRTDDVVSYAGVAGSFRDEFRAVPLDLVGKNVLVGADGWKFFDPMVGLMHPDWVFVSLLSEAMLGRSEDEFLSAVALTPDPDSVLFWCGLWCLRYGVFKAPLVSRPVLRGRFYSILDRFC